MKINILVAGMRYACPEHEDYVQTTEWLGKEHPEVIMVMKTNNHYGTTIVVKNGKKELGKVSRCHLEGVIALMLERKKKMLFGTAKTVDSDGGFFNVSLTLTDEEQALFDTAARGRKNRETWAGWEWTGGPLIGALEEDLDTEASINMLDAILEDDWQGREDLIIDTLKSLVATARYDISDETAQAFYRFRQLLTEHPSRQLRAYEPIFTKAMNDYGSAARQKEFATTFAARIINSEEARLMMQDWIDTHDVDPDDNAQMQELIDRELQRIDEALKVLPFNLYHDRNDIGLLMNHLVYKNIPRKQWQMLSSLLVMKYHLMEMWDEFCPEPSGERMDTPYEPSEGMSEKERMVHAIDATFEDLHLCKQEFSAIWKVIEEQYDHTMTMTAFERFVKGNCKMSPEYMPKCNNMKKIVFSGKFPKWKIQGFTTEKTNDYIEIGRRFVYYMTQE